MPRPITTYATSRAPVGGVCGHAHLWIAAAVASRSTEVTERYLAEEEEGRKERKEEQWLQLKNKQ